MTADLPEPVVEAIAAGRTVDAIKRLREATGMGLAEAKAVVETHGTRQRSGQDPSPEVRIALAAGRKLEAIKLYRDQTGVGLREARLRLEALDENRSVNAPMRSTGGFRSLLSLLLAIAAIVAVYAWLTPS